MRQYRNTFAALLLPVALALPNAGHGSIRRHEHKYGVSSSNGTPVPFSSSNATASTGTGAASYGYGRSSSSSIDTVYQPTIVSSSPNTVYQPTIASGTAAGAGSTAADAGQCEVSVVTVTQNPTATVTVTFDSALAGDASTSLAPATAVSSSAAVFSPSQSASKKPEASASTQASSSAPYKVSEAQTASTPSTIAAGSSSAATPYTAASSGAAPAASESTSGPKRGLLISGSSSDSLVGYANSQSKISWVVNWYSGPPNNLNENIEFVPQMYGINSDTAPNHEWTTNAEKAAQKAGPKHFLSFGEPNTYTTTGPQLHQDPSTGAANWIKEMQPYTNNVTVGAPGILQNTQDFTWLQQFLDACAKQNPVCDIGFIAIHWFDKAMDPNHPGATNAKAFQGTVNQAIQTANGKPVWVDNFQGSGTPEEQTSFLSEVVPWLESNPSVARYAYVPTDDAPFANSDGSATSLGSHYASL